MPYLIQLVKRTLTALAGEDGQGLVEYALILVLVAIVVIVVLALFGPHHRQRLFGDRRGHRWQRPGLDAGPIAITPCMRALARLRIAALSS